MIEKRRVGEWVRDEGIPLTRPVATLSPRRTRGKGGVRIPRTLISRFIPVNRNAAFTLLGFCPAGPLGMFVTHSLGRSWQQPEGRVPPAVHGENSPNTHFALYPREPERRLQAAAGVLGGSCGGFGAQPEGRVPQAVHREGCGRNLCLQCANLHHRGTQLDTDTKQWWETSDPRGGGPTGAMPDGAVRALPVGPPGNCREIACARKRVTPTLGAWLWLESMPASSTGTAGAD